MKTAFQLFDTVESGKTSDQEAKHCQRHNGPSFNIESVNHIFSFISNLAKNIQLSNEERQAKTILWLKERSDAIRAPAAAQTCSLLKVSQTFCPLCKSTLDSFEAKVKL